MTNSFDSSLETGLRSPLKGSRPPKKSAQQQLAEQQQEVLATPLSILKHRLVYVNRQLEAVTRIDSTTRTMEHLPTEYSDATLGAKLEARCMHAEFLKQEKKWYEDRIKELERNGEG